MDMLLDEEALVVLGGLICRSAQLAAFTDFPARISDASELDTCDAHLNTVQDISAAYLQYAELLRGTASVPSVSLGCTTWSTQGKVLANVLKVLEGKSRRNDVLPWRNVLPCHVQAKP